MDEVYNSTTLHPMGAVAVSILSIALLLVPRAWAFLPFILMASFVSPAQRVVVASLDFNLIRILVVAAWIRLLVRNELGMTRWRALDTAMIALAVCRVVMYTVQWQGAPEALIRSLGEAFDTIGLYFFFRQIGGALVSVTFVVDLNP